MTCYPDCNFLEFLPEEEIAVIKQRPDHKGKTVLFNEVQAGKRYEVVVTNLRRGAFVRYRVGDIVEFISLRDEELNVNLPQLVFYSRINDLIDIAGVAILTEGTIWEAIASADLPYADWVATKEYDGDRVLLHIYVEPKGEANAEEFRQRVHGNLQRLSREYADLERVWNMEPLRLTLLPEGAHKRFYETRVSQGADLAHMKPPHMNPSERVLRLLQGTALE
jgi:phenylacetate-coenzyme A ligase PaaK-like adenylate-forming protein